MSRVFSHGRLRLFLLLMLAEHPRHGYELIRHLEDRFLGLYTPSAGTIYPRLAALEEEGLVEHEEVEGRKVYRLTEAGQRELEAHRHELRDLEARAAESARHLAREIRHEVKASVRELRQELGVAMRDVRREERRTAREAARQRHEHLRDAARDVAREHFGAESSGEQAWASQTRARRSRTAEGRAREGGGAERDSDLDRRGAGEGDDVRSGDTDAADRLVLRSLGADLDAFVTDVMTAARQRPMGTDKLRAVRESLLAAREAVMAALSADSGPAT